MFLLIILGFLSMTLVKPAFANIPSVENTVVWKAGSETMLNVTVSHSTETAFHHVDWIEVNIDGDLRHFSQDVHTLDAQSTFTVTLNLGVIAGTPSATVQADCNLHGQSSVHTITVPEFGLQVLLLILVTSALVIVLHLRKTASRVHCD